MCYDYIISHKQQLHTGCSFDMCTFTPSRDELTDTAGAMMVGTTSAKACYLSGPWYSNSRLAVCNVLTVAVAYYHSIEIYLAYKETSGISYRCLLVNIIYWHNQLLLCLVLLNIG